MNFPDLVQVLSQTHHQLKRQAVRSIERSRQFYSSDPQIRQTVSDELDYKLLRTTLKGDK